MSKSVIARKYRTKIPQAKKAALNVAAVNEKERIMAGKKRSAGNEDVENKEEKDTRGHPQEEGDWKIVEGKKMAKDKRAKIQAEVAAMKTNNKEDANNQSKESDVYTEDPMDQSEEINMEETRYDTASEMETDTVSTARVHIAKARSENTKENTGEVRMTEEDTTVRKKWSREEYICYKGMLERISEIDASEVMGKKQVKFREGTNDTYKIILKLKRDAMQTRREAINKSSDTIGYTAEIDQRGSKYVGVITDWGDSIIDLWDSMDDHDDVEKISRMYRKKWDKEEKKLIEEDTGNLIITFNGDTVRKKLDLFGRSTAIKIRPYISAVKQCFKCFRYGHIKSACKSEEKCIICGETAHGNCTKENKCRNCGGKHRSTFRGCKIYEMNKNINWTMGYSNVSRREAERILAGKEKDQDQEYGRYEKPAEWPKLPPQRRDGEKREVFPAIRKTIVYEEERENNKQRRITTYKDKANTNKNYQGKNNNEYYRQFDNRSEEITKEKRGLAYNQDMKRGEERWDAEVSDNENETETTEEEVQDNGAEPVQKIPAGLNREQDIILNLAAKLKYYTDHDWEFRRILQEMIQGPEQKELRINDQEEAGRTKEEIMQRKKELELEEKNRRQRMIVGDIKKDFWKGRGRGVTREGDRPGTSQSRY
ncbi:uncharacterized protein [Temnothorax nylanderi]|uniref:uncharacterized protein n=1 Tax=Temnothorax nylanderi TaxID=102681 RepID=UPI003A85EE78